MSGGSDRFLALDVGARRIGLATADTSARMSVGLETLQRKRISDDVARITSIARDRKISRFVVGLPLNMDGGEGQAAAGVRQFAARLQKAARIPVDFQDERLTSFEAESLLRERGFSLAKMLDAKSKGALDRMAAVLILEDYLRRLPPQE